MGRTMDLRYMAGKYKGHTINCASWPRTLYAVWVAKSSLLAKECKHYSPLLQGDKPTLEECKKVIKNLSPAQRRLAGLDEATVEQILAQ